MRNSTECIDYLYSNGILEEEIIPNLLLKFLTYKEIRGKFSGHLWLDVVSKVDLLPKLPAVFINDEHNTEEQYLARYLSHGPDGAIRVSVMSGEGLDELKSKVHQLLIHQLSRIKDQKESEEGVVSPV